MGSCFSPFIFWFLYELAIWHDYQLLPDVEECHADLEYQKKKKCMMGEGGHKTAKLKLMLL